MNIKNKTQDEINILFEETLDNTIIEKQDIFKKSLYTLKNDLYYQFFENQEDKWFFDISYKPLQSPGGDSYSLRKIGDNKIFIFLVDAMGKGLTASITAIMSSSFLNYIVDEQQDKNDFYLEYTIKKYFSFISANIFDDENISASFIVFDFDNNIIESSIFGMPPILIEDNNQNITKIRSNNPPMSKYNLTINIQENSLEEVQKLLMYSDGLNETIINNNKIYAQYMENDFKNSSNHKSFLESALNKIENFDDDMTFFYIKKEKCNKSEVKNIVISSHINELDKVIEQVELFFHQHGLKERSNAYIINAFTEILLNAYEHGNLKISNEEKAIAINRGNFNNILQKRELIYGDKKIYINLHIKDEKHQKTFKIEVKDEGDGFNTDVMKNRIIKDKMFSGRGLIMISKMVDAFYYNQKGNKTILKKFQKKV